MRDAKRLLLVYGLWAATMPILAQDSNPPGGTNSASPGAKSPDPEVPTKANASPSAGGPNIFDPVGMLFKMMKEAPSGMPPGGMPPDGMFPSGMPPGGMPPGGMFPGGMPPRSRDNPGAFGMPAFMTNTGPGGGMPMMGGMGGPPGLGGPGLGGTGMNTGGPGLAAGPPGGFPPGGMPGNFDPNAPTPPPKIWSGRGDIGLNGQTGNTDLLSFRLNGSVTRRTEDNLFTFNATYNYTRLSPQSQLGGNSPFPALLQTQAPAAATPTLPAGITLPAGVTLPAGITPPTAATTTTTTTAAAATSVAAPAIRRISQQQAFLYAWDEFIEPGRPWNPFVSGLLEYDENRDYKFRTGGFTGVSYLFLNTPEQLFKTRVGVGGVYEYRDLDSRVVPEGLVGFDSRVRIWERNSIVTSIDVFPRLNHLGQFRVRGSTFLESMLNPEYHLFLRVGVQDRYDSDPGNRKRNDLTFFSSIGLSF